ncbi:hypothetical protein LWI28_016860 [Acer negundo]|uniref:Berberine/berberine-like domain-containing protein n=1 Tax=Acer negundo TaxID=4023 RepID=A0AAD5JQK7_ACENE|nr:hypothetical protein LWI28_016860 [Acer negundo]
MTSYVSSGPREAFLNYRDLDIGSINSSNQSSFKDTQVYGFKYFKGNFQRLVDVKAKWVSTATLVVGFDLGMVVDDLSLVVAGFGFDSDDGGGGGGSIDVSG